MIKLLYTKTINNKYWLIIINKQMVFKRSSKVLVGPLINIVSMSKNDKQWLYNDLFELYWVIHHPDPKTYDEYNIQKKIGFITNSEELKIYEK